MFAELGRPQELATSATYLFPGHHEPTKGMGFRYSIASGQVIATKRRKSP
jgi:hypothetical protein